MVFRSGVGDLVAPEDSGDNSAWQEVCQRFILPYALADHFGLPAVDNEPQFHVEDAVQETNFRDDGRAEAVIRAVWQVDVQDGFEFERRMSQSDELAHVLTRQMLGQLTENRNHVNEHNHTLEELVPGAMRAESKATVEYYGMRAMAVENGVDHRINEHGEIHRGCGGGGT